MNEVIEQLQQSATPSLIPLDLPEEDDLVLVEEEILLPIPREMRHFLLTVSDLILGSLEPVTVADPGAHTHLPEVASVAWANGIPREQLPLCKIDDNYYCRAEDGIVSFWQDGKQSDENWEDVWEWCEMVWLNS